MSGAVLAFTALSVLLTPGTESWRPDELKVKPPPPVIDFDQLQALALTFLGRPYVTGGVGSPGFDCSGFVCRVYAEAGYGLPRVSRDQAQAGLSVPLDAVQPGDLLFFAEDGEPISHVGIYLGDGSMIHASSGRGEVVVANLSQSWFQDRLVSARRVLTSTTGVPGPAIPEAPVRELVEHQGRFSLPPMVRRPSRRPPPSFGPELAGAGVTSLGFRSAFLTEAGVLGAVLAPEATLHVESWALDVAVAVPVRLEVDEDITVGTFERWQDYTRFLRHLSLGLPGADLELRLSRLGDVSLGTGVLVDRLAPGTRIRGVPGLSVARSPLTFFGRARASWVEVEAMLDDAVDPRLFGVGLAVPLGPVQVGLTAASDQQAELGGERRAFNAAEAHGRWSALSNRSWDLDLTVSAAGVLALGEAGFGALGGARGQWRPRSTVTVSAELRAGIAGPRFLSGLFGPTYLAYRGLFGEGLAELHRRGVVEGRAELAFGRIQVGGGYGQGFGARRHPLDQRLEAYVNLAALPLARARRLDLRLVLMSRSLFDPRLRAFTAHGGARVTLTDWAFAELYVQKSETWEGGGGLTVTWAP